MTASDSTTSVDERRPGWVALASILLFISASVGAFSCLATHGLSLVGLLLFALNAGLVAIAAGVMLLKKWGYWAYIGVTALGVMNIVADLALVALSMAPRETITVMGVVRGLIGTAWLVYFFTEPVKAAFGLGPIIAQPTLQSDGPASGGPAA